MKSAVLAVACCIFAAAASAAAPGAAAPALSAEATAVAAAAAVAPEPVAPAAAPAAPVVPTAALTPAPPVIYAPTATGSLLQTTLALSFVLALLAALAWAMKRYGPRSSSPNATLRLVGSLSLGGRERILIVEVADQWIVVGAAPGRVNALALMPRQPGSEPGATLVQGASGANFAQWLKQTIDKRNGK
jgi:flagellar protein FliO/FliZ